MSSLKKFILMLHGTAIVIIGGLTFFCILSKNPLGFIIDSAMLTWMCHSLILALKQKD